MTKTKQDKTVKTDAVELNDAALDQAAGSGSVLVPRIGWEVVLVDSTPGTNVLKSNDTSGRGG